MVRPTPLGRPRGPFKISRTDTAILLLVLLSLGMATVIHLTKRYAIYRRNLAADGGIKDLCGNPSG
jgi:hypothetical protein